jgi:hypothetical protein
MTIRGGSFPEIKAGLVYLEGKTGPIGELCHAEAGASPLLVDGRAGSIDLLNAELTGD